MLVSEIPLKLPVPFGNSAGGSYIRAIPVASQIGIVDGAASLTTGFPPVTFQPIESGGIPPNGADFNGILFEISGWSRWQAAGGPVFYDGTFSTAIGGYPKGAVLKSTAGDGLFWVSTADANTTNPDADPTLWLPLAPVPASNADMTAGTSNVKFATPATVAFLRATGAEVIAGTDATKFITPAAFYNARASAAEVRAGTDDHKYVTPASLQVGNTVGVTYLPGGLIMQQAAVSTTFAQGNRTTSFVTPFPTSVENVVLVAIVNSGSGNKFAYWRRSSTSLSTLAFTVQDTEGSGSIDGISYVAFGR